MSKPLKPNITRAILVLAIIALALALRLPELQQRPMHGDEAVHAIKFGALLEDGYYRYDSFEYHGPTLNYFTLLPAWLSGTHRLVQVNEWTLRLVPVFFGLVLVLLPLLLTDARGKAAAFIAAALTAISPAMAYYSRYYIQEMLLVCFTAGVIVCGYRYAQSQRPGWAVALGVFFGLMHATKETCIIAWAAMAMALLAIWRGEAIAHLKKLNRRHVLAAALAAAAVSLLFFSSFFTHARGILDSFLTYKTYLTRAGDHDLHIHPWHYYLHILAYFRLGNNPFWSEGLILGLAVVGCAAAFKKNGSGEANQALLRFLVFYTVIMTAAYSVIPYKTPWNMLSFLHGMILLAGAGAMAMFKMLSLRSVRAIALIVLLGGGMHLAWQSYLANYRYDENPANPYVYAHPVNDVFEIVQRVEEIAQIHPDGRKMHVQVICPDNDYWPLPWYLRAFDNIGWWREVDIATPAAQLVIAAPQFEPALLHKFYELPPPGQRYLYVPLFDGYTELRPQIELRGYVRKDLWDRLQEHEASSKKSSNE